MKKINLIVRFVFLLVVAIISIPSDSGAQFCNPNIPGNVGDPCGTIAGCVCGAGLECVLDDPNISDSAGVCQDISTRCILPPADFTEASVKWQSIGSTGAVDEGSLDLFKFWGTTVRVLENNDGTVDIRYNVDCERELTIGFNLFEARYKDDGDAAQVIVKFKRISFETGAVETLYVFDSDNWCPSASVQTIAELLPQGYTELQCNEYSYYLEAKVIKAGNGDPALGILRLRGYH